MAFKSLSSGKKFSIWLFILIILGIGGAGIWYTFMKFEGEVPSVKFTAVPAVFLAETELSGMVIDQKSGIKKVGIHLVQENKDIVLSEEEYPSSNRQIPFNFALNAKKLGISDGKAKLIFTVWDNSWRNWWNGNKLYFEKEVLFDTRPPVINVLSGQHYINRGGTGLVIYQLSEPCENSGVYAGEEFYPGHAGYFPDKSIYLAFFTVKPDQDSGTQLYVNAVDIAGNASRSGFYYRILDKQFMSETINVSDSFLNSKFPEFQAEEGWPKNASIVEKFRFINKILRVRNNETILQNGKQTDCEIYWEGPFLRMQNAAPMASYADHRSYSYNGDVIDLADHMGIDLASLTNAEVQAANGGKVVFVGNVGIYGNTICIDHGFGLFTIYSHLSQMSVQAGDKVSKGDVIGRTGTTGWAGGDHLHYGMFVDHIFVNPMEWWDPSWIKNNITDKIKGIAGK